ncbi:MAG: L,D-transpeptidase [Hyphomicrobiaceae bacterium]
MLLRLAGLGPVVMAFGLGLVPTTDTYAGEPARIAAAPATAATADAVNPPPFAAVTGGEAKSPATTVPGTKPIAAITPIAPAPSGAAPAAPVPTGPVVVARVDLSSQTMTVSIAGQPAHSWRISSGAIGYRTPTGTFSPQILSKHHRSSLYYGAPMPYAVFFNGHIATHGTTAVRHLGRPASHGCVRLDTANARTFFELVQKHGKANVRVVVEGTTPSNGISVASSRRRSTTASAGSGSAISNGRYSNWARQAFATN